MINSDSRIQLLYLASDDVRDVCKDIDSIALMREVLGLHGLGETVLPSEAYLSWNTPKQETVRSLNMPAYVGGIFHAAGTKIINSNPQNSARGLPRASGLTLLFEPESGQVVCVLEGSHISAMRTASVTFLSVGLLTGRPVQRLAVIGGGVIGVAHIELGVKTLPSLERIVLFDIDSGVATALATKLEASVQNKIAIEVAKSVIEALRGADVIILATTTTSGYISYDSLEPGAIVINVSLDDLLPDAFLKADLLFVDDWNLIRTDTRRLLGRMYRKGLVVGPKDPSGAGRVRKIDGELSDLILGRHPGRNSIDDIIIVNPFGLGIEDVAFASRIFGIARAKGVGKYFPY